MAKKRYEVSLIEQDAVVMMHAMHHRGLCMHKFHANHVCVGIALWDLHVGQRIECDGRFIEIQQVGKQCFDGCVFLAEGGFCPLKKGCAFGRYVDKEIANKVPC
jgi:MOSC domain-containing protein YiiM